MEMIEGIEEKKEGEIKIGEKIMEKRKDVDIRKRMRWVGKKKNIFEGYERKNIKIGRYEEREEIEGIIDDKELRNVEGVEGNRLIGENGEGMYGGEELRIEMERIEVDNEEDIIIEDEKKENIDNEKEEKIEENMVRIDKGKKMIVEKNDEKMERRMNRIVRMDNRGEDEDVIKRRDEE